MIFNIIIFYVVPGLVIIGMIRGAWEEWGR